MNPLDKFKESQKSELIKRVDAMREKLFSGEGFTPSYPPRNFTEQLEHFLRNDYRQDLKNWHINNILAYYKDADRNETVCAIRRPDGTLEMSLLIDGVLKWRISDYQI